MRGAAVSGAVAGIGLADRLWHHDPDRLVVLAIHDVPSGAIAADDLATLRRVAQPVDLDAVLAAHRGETPLPRRAVLVTLDDGDPSVADHAEVFAEQRVPAVCFVVSSVIGSTSPFWWHEVSRLTRWGARHAGPGPAVGGELVMHLKGVSDDERRRVLEELRAQVTTPVEARQLTAAELVDLEAAGIEVGGHSVSHPILVECDDAVLDHEVSACRTQLATLLGRTPRAFAYPSGRIDGRVAAAVERAGWEVAFAWDHAVAEVPFPDRLRVSRVQCSLGSGRLRLAQLATARHRSLRSSQR